MFHPAWNTQVLPVVAWCCSAQVLGVFGIRHKRHNGMRFLQVQTEDLNDILKISQNVARYYNINHHIQYEHMCKHVWLLFLKNDHNSWPQMFRWSWPNFWGFHSAKQCFRLDSIDQIVLEPTHLPSRTGYNMVRTRWRRTFTNFHPSNRSGWWWMIGESKKTSPNISMFFFELCDFLKEARILQSHSLELKTKGETGHGATVDTQVHGPSRRFRSQQPENPREFCHGNQLDLRNLHCKVAQWNAMANSKHGSPKTSSFLMLFGALDAHDLELPVRSLGFGALIRGLEAHPMAMAKIDPVALFEKDFKANGELQSKANLWRAVRQYWMILDVNWFKLMYNLLIDIVEYIIYS